jgi:hypothetical protein
MASTPLAELGTATLVLNLYPTADGALTSLCGPAPLLPDKGDPRVIESETETLRAIFHGSLRGGTIPCLLVHRGNKIDLFVGSQSSSGGYSNWVTVIGPSSASPMLEYELPDDDMLAAPTQFVQVSTGIVIIPQGSLRAFFFDGEKAGFLGYSSPPAAPLGASAYTVDGGTVNGHGYTGLDSAPLAIEFGFSDFGKGRLGTYSPDLTGATGGAILRSQFQAAVQFIDAWGNVSPVSERSEVIEIAPNEIPAGDKSEDYQHAILWTNIVPGPEGTVGRILLHTKDMNVGDAGLYSVSGNSIGGLMGAWATFPDNITTRYHYNRPVSSLLASYIDAMPVPSFRLACAGIGRLWIAGIEGDEGAVIPSLPGRWGTFARATELYPDSNGGKITALHSSGQQIFVFTARSVFMIGLTDNGEGFTTLPISTTVGCVAPNSVADLPGGGIIWLSATGFHMFLGGKGVIPATQDDNADIREHLTRITWGRAGASCAVFDSETGEYRCWVPADGSQWPELGFIFDTKAGTWRLRSHEKPRAVCVLRDSGLMLGVGYVPLESGEAQCVFVFDREHIASAYRSRWIIETAWVQASESKDKRSAKYVRLWLIETQPDEKISVRVYRDYRRESVSDKTYKAELAPAPDPSDVAIWGKYTWGQSKAPNSWAKPRPTWRRVDVYVPSCEVWMLQITGTCRFKIIGWSFDEAPHEGRP